MEASNNNKKNKNVVSYYIKSIKNIVTAIFTTNQHNKNKLHILLLLLLLATSWLTTKWLTNHEVDAKELQQGIASEIIRFHVIANSDSEDDQALKYKVKDALVNELSSKLKATNDIDQAREVIIAELSYIQKKAEEVVNENGYSYPITVTLEPHFFPLKVYGDYTFPPGTYEALRVQIGEAEGQNWWCVMFPPLCFVDETYSIVDGDSKNQLKYLLTDEEYNSITSSKVPVKIRFKLFEKIKKIFID